METISWADFEKVELRIGTVIEVEDFPEARKPAFKLKVDFGDEVGVKKQIGPMQSECLVTGFNREDGAVVLAGPDSSVPNGAKLA